MLLVSGTCSSKASDDDLPPNASAWVYVRLYEWHWWLAQGCVLSFDLFNIFISNVDEDVNEMAC